MWWHCSKCGDAYLAGALGAAVHGPLVFVLVHHAVVEADSAVDVHLVFQQRAVLRLGERREKEREGGCSGWRTENFHFAKVPIQMNH